MAGVTALGMIGVQRAHAGDMGLPDLDDPVQTGVWKIGTISNDAVWGILLKMHPVPKDFFEKKPESLI